MNDFSIFAIGSEEPKENVGPWLKDGEVWCVFDDEKSKYVPILNIYGGAD